MSTRSTVALVALVALVAVALAVLLAGCQSTPRASVGSAARATIVGSLQAGVIIAAVPCGLLFLLLQRYYVKGFSSGALKR